MITQETLFDYLLKKEVTVVFDVDGVLAPYEWGDRKHCVSDDEWNEMLEEGIDVYSNVKPIETLQRFIRRKGTENVYVCSESNSKEYDSKVAFCMNKYGIPRDHIILVGDKKYKVNFLNGLSLKTNLYHDKIALIEDTVETLNQAARKGYCTVHISSFFNFKENFVVNQVSNQNKYQEALDFLQEECRTIKKGEAKKYIKVLQKLVDKETVMKAKKITVQGYDWDSMNYVEDEEYICPICQEPVVGVRHRCTRCGQSLRE